MNRYALAGTIAGATALADHVTKILIVRDLKPLHHPVTVIPGFFDLTYRENTGSAFGMLTGFGGMLTLIGVGALCFVAWLLHKNPGARRRSVVALGLILGGAVGNVVDRILRGYVVDFIDWYAGARHWPAFNVADSALVIGVVMILIWPEKSPASAPSRSGR
jgi:signal peptidase II